MDSSFPSTGAPHRPLGSMAIDRVAGRLASDENQKTEKFVLVRQSYLQLPGTKAGSGQFVAVTDENIVAQAKRDNEAIPLDENGVALLAPSLNQEARDLMMSGTATVVRADGTPMSTNVQYREVSQDEYSRYLNLFFQSVQPMKDQNDPDHEQQVSSKTNLQEHAPVHLNHKDHRVKVKDEKSVSLDRSKYTNFQQVQLLFNVVFDARKDKSEKIKNEQIRNRQIRNTTEEMRSKRKSDLGLGSNAYTAPGKLGNLSATQDQNERDWHRTDLMGNTHQENSKDEQGLGSVTEPKINQTKDQSTVGKRERENQRMSIHPAEEASPKRRKVTASRPRQADTDKLSQKNEEPNKAPSELSQTRPNSRIKRTRGHEG